MRFYVLHLKTEPVVFEREALLFFLFVVQSPYPSLFRQFPIGYHAKI